jgi:DNA-binding NtrC family response regulator
VGPVSTIAQAEEIIGQQRVDAAVLDLNLHGEMASNFVQKLSASELPCLIVSGYGADAIPESVTAVARLEKPVSPSAVIDSLAAELSRVRVS